MIEKFTNFKLNNRVLIKKFQIYLRFLSIYGLIFSSFSLIIYGVYFYGILKNNYLVDYDKTLSTETTNLTLLNAIEYFTLLFMVITAGLVLLITYYKRNKRERRKERAKYIHVFVDIIFQLIHSKDENEIETKKIELKNYWFNLKSDYSQRLFINILRQIHLETSGELNEKSVSLFSTLDADFFIRAYLNSPFLRNNLFALKTIRDFHLVGYENLILKLTKSRNDILQSAALNTIVRFEDYKNLNFLINNDINISYWNINHIISTQETLQNNDIDYETLLKSKNYIIVILGIILVRIFKKNEFKDIIKHKINDPNISISESAIKSFIALAETPDDYFYLRFIYNSASENCKSLILKSFIKSTDKVNTIKFLKFIVFNEPISQKIIAIQVLLEIDLMQIALLKSSENPDIVRVCDHVLDFNN